MENVTGQSLHTFPFTGNSSINNCKNLTPLEIYKNIVDDKITNHMVTETNQFGQKKNGNS